MDTLTKDAIEILRRAYEGEAPEPLYDDGMTLKWIDEEIAAFIRRYGSFKWILRDE